MNYFALTLQDGFGCENFDAVTQFIGADASGSFGVLAGHRHMVAMLRYGLARFCDSTGNWHYLAMPGAVLRFFDNRLTVTTVRYFLGDDRTRICRQLEQEMAQQDSEVYMARATLAEIERSLIRRLAELSKGRAGGMLL